MVYTFRVFDNYIFDNQILKKMLGLHEMLITCGKITLLFKDSKEYFLSNQA